MADPTPTPQGDLFETPPVPAAHERRIDITLQRMADIFDTLPREHQERLSQTPQWSAIVLLSEVRAMERAEAEVLGRPVYGSVAEIFDQVTSPGELAVEALLRTFRVAVGRQQEASHG